MAILTIKSAPRNIAKLCKLLLLHQFFMISHSIAGTWDPSGGASTPVFATELFGERNKTVITPRAAAYILAVPVAVGDVLVECNLSGGVFGKGVSKRLVRWE